MQVFRTWLLLALTAACAGAADLSLRYERWTWTEQDEAGRRMLREEGPLLGLGMETSRDAGNWILRGRARGFLGEVDYDGATQAGDPVETTTEYYGLTTELEARRPVSIGPALELQPLAGLGWRGWLRRIDNSGRFSSGYDEAWNTVYALLGAGARWSPQPDTTVFAEAALRLPAFNEVRYSLAFNEENDHATVEPGRDPSWRAEAGVERLPWKVSLFIERLVFSRSETRIIPPFEVFQPESEGELIGIQFGAEL
jgi:hypothetical protein